MPKGRYTIGGKGTHGCKGYPVVGDTGKVHGCHATVEAAQNQQAAIYASEAAREKKSADENERNGKRKKEHHINKSSSIVSDHPDCKGYGLVNESGELVGCYNSRAEAESAASDHESQDTESQHGPGHDVNKSMNLDPGLMGEEREAVLEDNDTPLGWNGMFSPVMTKASKPNYGNIIKPRKGSPSNKELYARIIAEAKSKFDVYPSAVANSWVVAEYKRRGGKYSSN